jgi:hypothetical protein
LETPEGFVGLVKLSDYWKFLQDNSGDLDERIFESNVRGFQQNTPVNASIRDTLNKPGKADFWLLNNGITILAGKGTTTAGYKKLEIDDPQIVNGLQTSRLIDAYYRAGVGIPSPDEDSRRIMVRVIKSSDEHVSDDVIRADLPPENCTSVKESSPGYKGPRRTSDEAEPFHGGADHWGVEGSRSGDEGWGGLSEAWNL